MMRYTFLPHLTAELEEQPRIAFVKILNRPDHHLESFGKLRASDAKIWKAEINWGEQYVVVKVLENIRGFSEGDILIVAKPAHGCAGIPSKESGSEWFIAGEFADGMFRGTWRYNVVHEAEITRR